MLSRAPVPVTARSLVPAPGPHLTPSAAPSRARPLLSLSSGLSPPTASSSASAHTETASPLRRPPCPSPPSAELFCPPGPSGLRLPISVNTSPPAQSLGPKAQTPSSPKSLGGRPRELWSRAPPHWPASRPLLSGREHLGGTRHNTPLPVPPTPQPGSLLGARGTVKRGWATVLPARGTPVAPHHPGWVRGPGGQAATRRPSLTPPRCSARPASP